jgi:hypothetical protein
MVSRPPLIEIQRSITKNLFPSNMLSLDPTAFQYPRLISTVDDVTLAAEVPRLSFSVIE